MRPFISYTMEVAQLFQMSKWHIGGLDGATSSLSRVLFHYRVSLRHSDLVVLVLVHGGRLNGAKMIMKIQEPTHLVGLSGQRRGLDGLSVAAQSRRLEARGGNCKVVVIGIIVVSVIVVIIN